MKLSELKLTDKIFYGNKADLEGGLHMTLCQVKDLPAIYNRVKKLVLYEAKPYELYYGINLDQLLEWHLDYLHSQDYETIDLEDKPLTEFIDKYTDYEDKSSDELLNTVKENGYSIEEATSIINNILFSNKCKEENYTKTLYKYGDDITFTKKDIENIKEQIKNDKQ